MVSASQTVKNFKSDEKTKHHKNLLDHLTRSKTFSRKKNPIYSKSDWINPLNLHRKNQNLEYIYFSRILIYSEECWRRR